MNNLDKQYTQLLDDILTNGVIKKDRTGTGTMSVFGRQIRHKMSEGFPILTTKKIPFKTMATELCWFLRGNTNIRWLVQNNCNIWNGDAYKAYKIQMERGKHGAWLNEKEFIEEIKTNDEFANQWGDLGPIYGEQWRSWNTHEDVANKTGELYPSGEFKYDFTTKKIDQIKNLVYDLKNNPDSRRLMVSAWNVAEINQMTLPPCHYGFQCYTRELTEKERFDYGYNILKLNGLLDAQNEEESIEWMNEWNVPKRALSLMWNQRSVDTFLGLPFNISSYGLLLEILAKEVNMVPDELIANLGDTHLYLNHLTQSKEQIGRKLSDAEVMDKLNENDAELFNKLRAIKKAKKEAILYQEYEEAAGLKMREMELMDEIPLVTREPFKLPTLQIEDEVKWREGDCLPYYHPDNIKLKNYKYHPPIKAPLSN